MAQQRNLSGNRDKDGNLKTVNYDDMPVEDLLSLYKKSSLGGPGLTALTTKILTNVTDNASEEDIKEFMSELPPEFISNINMYIDADNVFDMYYADKDRQKMEGDWFRKQDTATKLKEKSKGARKIGHELGAINLQDVIDNVKNFFKAKN